MRRMTRMMRMTVPTPMYMQLPLSIRAVLYRSELGTNLHYRTAER
jgi:hypothetical protein